MKVQVEIEDLETLIFATSIIKVIEGCLQSRKTDPFVKPHLEYTDASNRLAAAMNHARREYAETAVEWNGVLTREEEKLLKEFIASKTFQITGEFRKKDKAVDSLAVKGCIRIGQLIQGAVWPGEDRPDIQPVPGYALAITPRGQDKLEKLTHADK